MNKIVNDLRKEYSLYNDREIRILAKKYFNINDERLTTKEVIEKMISLEIRNSLK